MITIFTFNNLYIYPKLKNLLAVSYVILITNWIFWVCLALTTYLAFLDPGFVKPEKDSKDYFLKLLINNEP